MTIHIPDWLEQYRFNAETKTQRYSPRLHSTRDAGPNGLFTFPLAPLGPVVTCLVGTGHGWEHVSVTMPLQHRCCTWEEMCQVRDVFWPPEDCVVQYHPPQSDYVNKHPTCLHLWRPQDGFMPVPPTWMVG